MPSLIRLRQDIQFTTRLGGLLDALKSIAAQQFQSLERAFNANPPLFEAVQTIAGTFDLEHIVHPFTQAEGPVGVILVTSDTGLLGGLNQQVVSTGIQEYRREPGDVMVVGERGAALVRELGLPCKVFPGIQDSGRTALAAQVQAYALHRVLTGALAMLTIVYPRPLSFTVQRVEVVRVLPCTEWFRDGSTARGVRGGPVMLESHLAGILEYLVSVWLAQKLYEVFGLSRLAELAARAAHLEGSSQELQRRGKKLWLRYFRERREAIDRNIRELSSAKAISRSQEFEEPMESILR